MTTDPGTRSCQDCADECGAQATWRVREMDRDGEWLYCDEHVPYLDPGVEVFPLGVANPACTGHDWDCEKGLGFYFQCRRCGEQEWRPG